MPFNEAPCFPFYRPGESTGYSGGKEENERESRRPSGSPGHSSPSCGPRRPCRCQQGRCHVAALSVTGAMCMRRLPVMALHFVLADIVVNRCTCSVRTRVRHNSTGMSDVVPDVNPQVWPVTATGYIRACRSLLWRQTFDPGPYS